MANTTTKHTGHGPRVQARFWMEYLNSEGNISGSSKKAGISRETAYRWLNDWQPNGGPPDEVLKMIQDDADEFLLAAEDARMTAVVKLQELVKKAEEAKDIRNVALAFGILDDKIKTTKGLATKRTETTVNSNLSKDDLKELMKDYASQMVDAAATRQAVIKESDIEVGQLPSGDDPTD